LEGRIDTVKDPGTATIEGELHYYAQTLSPKLKTLEVIPISDAHYGNPLFSRKHFLNVISWVLEQPNRFVVLNGDLCESALRSSKGEIYRQVGTPQDQRDWIIERLTPIKDRILGMTTGNHENRIYNDCGLDISQDIARALGVPYRATGMLLKVSFGDYSNYSKDKPYVYWFYFTHGYGGARTKSSKAVKVERTSTWIDADCYIMSHDHVVNAAPDVYLLPDPRTHTDAEGFTVGKITAKRKMLVKSNAFIKWGGYSEMGGFPPVDLETPIIICSGEGKRQIRVLV
jgi:hypothetical protein